MTVEATVERAFEYFTVEMSSWWNADHHIIEAPFERMVFEPRVGGDIYDVGTDGSECRWSRVLAYEPPRRLVFSWDITTDWKLETDPTTTSATVSARRTRGGPRLGPRPGGSRGPWIVDIAEAVRSGFVADG
jgi:uncharacterized protein YndB with AHSA1/START domain